MLFSCILTFPGKEYAVRNMFTERRKISCKPIFRTGGGVFFLYIGNYSWRYNPAAPNVLADAGKTESGSVNLRRSEPDRTEQSFAEETSE